MTTVTLPGGQKVQTGIGFDYNPATAAWQPDLNGYDYDIATKYVEGALTGPDFLRLYGLEVERMKFPVATLEPATQDLLGARTQVLNVNKRYMTKQAEKHPYLAPSDYLKIQKFLNDADLIVDQGKKGIVFIAKEGEGYFEVVVDFGKGKTSLNFKSYYAVRESQIQARREGGHVLKDKLRKK